MIRSWGGGLGVAELRDRFTCRFKAACGVGW